MFEFIMFAGLMSFVVIFAYGFFQWIDKIELEKEYLQNLLKEQNNMKNTIRKGLM